ncbi:MAG: TlyA family rRNA (cytidine-2'-O)-methyltransferase [Candidatus Tectimicrobiota bacterium]|nr:MAG: TlyA family rRNA (cytidine-2'-O)-methyltransferase [Candidatus Tectomicrobia bacterium]
MSTTERLDLLLVKRGLVRSREQARRLILAGKVTVAGQPASKAGTRVPVDAALAVQEACPYVSRGGLKLAAALDHFQLEVRGWVAADIGAGTGGFTDCLLQRGVRRVYAIDVGYGQLAWSLRQDPRVVVMERVNARYLTAAALPEPVDLVTIDVSFISLLQVLPAALTLLKPAGQVVALVKPQFEARRGQVGKGGIVRDPAVHAEVLRRVTAWAVARGLVVRGLMPSPLRGAEGNVEFFLHLAPGGRQEEEIEALVAQCLAAAAP